jgi:hypothetical protein
MMNVNFAALSRSAARQEARGLYSSALQKLFRLVKVSPGDVTR